MSKTLACCYTRFSTDQQNQSSTIGQLKAIKSYCDKHNIEIIETYIDEAQTGTNMNRKNFQKLMADAPTALWDTVVVYNMSRLSRSVKDTLVIKEEFKKMGKKILSVIENQDETPEGDFFNLITYGMNELFVKQFKRDSWRGLMVNATECKVQGGVPPLGYSVGKDKKYILEESEAEIIRIIFNKTVEGWSYRQISNFLNENGYTNRGKKFGLCFTDILRNEKYAGVYVWNLRESKENLGRKTNRKYKPKAEVVRIEGGMPQIVDTDVFEKVQQIMNARKRHYKRKAPNSKYLLSKILVCEKCGRSYSGGYTWSGNGKNFRKYYRCCNRECKNKDINMDYLDRYIKLLIEKLVLNYKSIDAYQDFLNTYQRIKIEKINRKIDLVKKRKIQLKEEATILANNLKMSIDDEYVELTKLLGKNSADRTNLDTEELKLKEESNIAVKYTKEKIQDILKNEKHKIKSIGIKDVVLNVFYKIEMGDKFISIFLDLSYLFQILDGENRLLIQIKEPRENIAQRFNSENIDYSIDRFKQILKIELKRRYNE